MKHPLIILYSVSILFAYNCIKLKGTMISRFGFFDYMWTGTWNHYIFIFSGVWLHGYNKILAMSLVFWFYQPIQSSFLIFKRDLKKKSSHNPDSHLMKCQKEKKSSTNEMRQCNKLVCLVGLLTLIKQNECGFISCRFDGGIIFALEEWDNKRMLLFSASLGVNHYLEP